MLTSDIKLRGFEGLEMDMPLFIGAGGPGRPEIPAISPTGDVNW